MNARAAALHPVAQTALAVAAGGIAALGQAPFAIEWLTLLGLALAFLLLDAAPGYRAAFRLGWGAGAGHFLVALHWIVEPFFVDAARHAWMAPFALVFLAGGLALFWGGAAWAAKRASGGSTAGLALAFPAALALAEWLRGWIFTGFPWAAPAHVWADHPARSLLAVIGTTGLTLLTVLSVTGLAALLGRRRSLLWPVAAPLLVLPFLGAGVALAPAPQEPPEDAPRIRLVQPNAPQHQKWDPEHVLTFYQRQLRYTQAPGGPDVIVWPETAIPWPLDVADQALAQIAEAAGGNPVVLGIRRREAGAVYNSLVVTGPGGRPRALYDKHHLVPFGEYMPLAPLARAAGIAGLAANDAMGFSAGPGPRLLDLGDLGRALPLICYELIFPRNVLGAPERPDLLLHLTNDAWFGRTAGPQQHLAQAQVRAAETGLPAIRAANTGISAVIDATGAIRDSLPLGEAGYLDAALPLPRPATLYARTGNGPALAVAVSLLLFAAFLGFRNSD